jgi:hypothetical protein
MNDLERVKEKANDLRLSLEALSTVGKPKRQERPLAVRSLMHPEDRRATE